jgi:hypothetical protein
VVPLIVITVIQTIIVILLIAEILNLAVVRLILVFMRMIDGSGQQLYHLIFVVAMLIAQVKNVRLIQ